MQDIAIHQLILTICYYLHLLIYEKFDYTSEKKINTTSSLTFIHTKISKILLNIGTYANKTKSSQKNEDLLDIIKTIATSTVAVIKDRHYERVSKKPLKKFRVKEIKSKKEKKENKQKRKQENEHIDEHIKDEHKEDEHKEDEHIDENKEDEHIEKNIKEEHINEHKVNKKPRKTLNKKTKKNQKKDSQ